MKRLYPILSLLLFSQLACVAVMGTPAPPPIPTNTSLPPTSSLPTLPPTVTPKPTLVLPTLPPPSAQPTAAPSTPEEINQGTHTYWSETVENGCAASEDSQDSAYIEKTHNFAPDLSNVDYAGRIYARVDAQIYFATNQSDRPLLLRYYEDGYILEVFNPGEDPFSTPACLTFYFLLEE